jgi:peptide/nickel transport system permease protein
VFSRIIWGTRIALIVGLSSAIVSILIGVPLGLISGFVSGPLDRILTLLMDSLYSFPGLILAIAIAAVLGAGIGNVIVAIAVLYVPTYFRIVRGQTLSVKQELYVEAARSLGARPWTILWQYIFPNVIPSVVIIFSVNVADAILTEAGLSFLGLGLPPDTPDWGIDLARGQDYLRRAWWLITFPGLMVSLVTLSFSMLGESLSEILNPRLAEL